MEEYLDRTTIILVGVCNYNALPRLHGPEKDVKMLYDLFCNNKQSSIVDANDINEFINPSSDELRAWFSHYSLSRTAPKDVLIVYFSGHGLVLNDYDFAFCTVETVIHPEYQSAIPTNLVRFSDIVQSLAAAHVDPIFIIDACFSGEAGTKIKENIQVMQRTIQADTGSSYALLVSGYRFEESYSSPEGGVLSKSFTDIADSGRCLGKLHNKPYLSLSDIFPELQEMTIQRAEQVPQLFLGETLTPIAIVKNKKYKPYTVTINRGQINVLHALWNNGDPIELSTSALQQMGSTEHTTYMKLSYKPDWNLIEKLDSKTRRLTDRGVLFMKGELKIPKTIVKDPVTDQWNCAKGSPLIKRDEI